MNFRFKHIRYRLVLQIAIFFVYILAVGGILWFAIGKINKIKVATLSATAIKEAIYNSHDLYTNFLLKSDTDRTFITSGNNLVTKEFKNNITHILDSIKQITWQEHLTKYFKSNNKDSLVNSLKTYSKNFDLVALTIQQRGIKDAGTIQELRSISDNLLIALFPAKNSDAYERALALKQLETEYLFASSASSYNDIEKKLDELSDDSQLPDLPSIDKNQVNKLVKNYKNKFEYLNAIYQRINGTPKKKGVLSDFEHQYRKVLADYSAFHQIILEKSKVLKRLWIIIAGIVLLIISALYILLIFQILFKLEPALNKVVEFSFKISKGKYSNKVTDDHLPYEFSALGQHLNKIDESILSKQKFVDHLLKQRYDVDLTLTGKNDTFGKTLLALKENMRKAREEQVRYAEENKLRRFHNEGVAMFADILRTNSSDLTVLADIFIRELVKYLEAIQGGLFLLDEEDQNILNLVAAFAYNRKKYLSRTVKLRQGLVGSCAIEKKTINLSKIPEDYIEITSGLGDASPSNLLLMPVMHEGNLIGVVELASINSFEQHQIEVGENICSSLAATIIATRNNSRTSELLTKSQRQAAEMAEQEEEMRQNMEELKATQEESARREEELEGILNALNQSFYVLEYATDGIISKANDKVALLFGLKSEDIIGKTHQELFGKGSKADDIFFAGISKGNTVELIEQVTINKKPLEIKNTFSPIKTKEGSTTRILNIFSVNV